MDFYSQQSPYWNGYQWVYYPQGNGYQNGVYPMTRHTVKLELPLPKYGEKIVVEIDYSGNPTIRTILDVPPQASKTVN